MECYSPLGGAYWSDVVLFPLGNRIREEASMAVLTDAEARRMLELLKEALSPKSITLNKGEKQFQLHQISL